MNLLAWNCNMAFRKKWPALNAFPADIMVISECERADKFSEKQRIPGCEDFVWIGKSEHKGLGVMSFHGYRLEICSFYSDEYEYVLPLWVEKGGHRFLLFAIWAMPHPQSNLRSYVGQIWAALTHYQQHMQGPILLAGDFNSHPMWDGSRKVGHHTDVAQFLGERGIHSLYHHHTGEAAGAESQPTLYLLKQMAKPYHLDYCFASQSLIGPETRLQVGAYADWITWSDHMPLWVENLAC
ncbi:MAG: endonuclease/exonuclease/phosphatase family protein [Bacteroidota bacterium]